MSKRVEISLPSGKKAVFLLNDSSHVISDFDSSDLKGVSPTFSYDGVWFYHEAHGNWFIKCDDSSRHVDVSETYLDESLKSVDDSLFGDSDEVAIKILGNEAFKKTKISEINLSDVDYVGRGCFSNCSFLEKVKLPSDLRYISNYLFENSGEDKFELVDSLSNVEVIGVGAFSRTGLKHIKFSDNLRSIGKHAFKGCENIEKVNFPESLQEIGDLAFKSTGIRELKLPSKVKNIQQHSFSSCFNLKEVVIPNTVLNIERGAFAGCSSLERFVFPMHMETISNSVLKNCGKLKNVSFPINAKKIEYCAFEECDELDVDLFSDTIEEIGDMAFKNCKRLGSRYNNFLLSDDTLDGATSVYDKNVDYVDYTSMTSNLLPKNIKKIGREAFCGCENLFLDENFPEGLEIIEEKAFFNTDLYNVMLPRNIKKVGKEAFDNCRWLTYVSYFDIPITGAKIYFDSIDQFVDNLYKGISEHKSHIRFDVGNDNSVFNTMCSEIVTEIIKKMYNSNDRSKIFGSFIKDFEYDTFKNNVSYLCSLGFNKSDITEFVVRGCYGIGSVSFDEAFSNYEYLLNQKILDKSILDSLYFSNAEGSTLAEKFKNYCLSSHDIPDLFKTLMVKGNDNNRLELRDRLIYVSTMQFLDGNYTDFQYNKAVSMLRRTLFSNIIVNDKREMSRINEDVYEYCVEKQYHELSGLMMPLYKKLNGIDSNWFDELVNELFVMRDDSVFRNFYNSLTTIKNWDSYSSEVERATFLKNELVGRLLYADIALTLDGLKLKSGDYYNKYVELKRQGKSVSVKELLEYANKPRSDLFKNPAIINTMLKIDPYSFDSLRVAPNDMSSLDKNDVQVKFAGIAKTHGYSFEDAEIDIYTKLRNYAEFESDKRVKSYADFVNNSVGLAKIPNEDKERYLMRIKKMAQAYVESQDDNDLFSMCRSLDLYLRNNQIYDRNDEDVEKTAKVVFDQDSDISNDARILYCLYNLNRLAHDTYELNTKAAIKLNFRLATSNIVDEKKLNDVFSAYNYLYSCGFDSDKVRSLLKDKNESLFKEYSDLSDDEKNEVLSGLNFFRKKDIRSKKISEDELTEIRKKLILIDSLNDRESELINSSIEEQNIFFECKRLFSEEIMNRMVREFSNDFIKMFEASDDEKVKYYAENGYIAEVQDSSGGPTLVCLCNEFNEPFSIHLKDLPDEISNALDNAKRSETIAHCSLDGKGITLRDSDFEKDLLNNTDSADNFVGFKKGFVGVRLPQAIRSNFDRYDVPAAHYIAKKNEFNNMFENENSSNAALGDAYSKK